MKVTMKEIALEAGVSIMTVSNVINGKGGKVSKDKQDEILKLIKKYNYSPNMNAKALVKASSRLIGLLFYSDSPDYDFSDPFATEVLSGIEKIAKKENYFILLQNVNTIEDVQVIQSNWAFDGFIAVGFYQEIYMKIIEAVSVPIVFIDTHLNKEGEEIAKERDNIYFVKTDDFLQARKAIQYLTDQGHAEIAFLSYSYDLDIIGVIQQRFLGYRSGLNDAQLAFDEKLIYTEQEFETIAANLTDFSAVLVTADYLAMNFIKFLRDRDLYDIHQTSVISIDDIRYAQLNNPPLTTIRLNQEEKGKVAIRKIIQCVEKKAGFPKMTIIDGNLIQRDSVMKLN